MAKITGLGGVFFKTDPAATAGWLTDNLGLKTEPWGVMFPWREADGDGDGYTVLGLHARDSDYFGPSKRELMLNLRVDDLDGMLAQLREKGVEIVKVFEPQPYGRFAHVRGPDDLVIELFEPAKGEPA
jgi:predicted enzyme related to lactoylglutathione lyase